MAFVHGSGATLTVNSGAITGFSNEATLSRSAEAALTTVFGVTSNTYVPGMKDATFSGSGFYDKTTTTGSIYILEAIYTANAAVACVYRPAGGGSGEYNYAFDGILTSYNITGSTDSTVNFDFEFQITGAVIPTTI